MSYTYTGLNFGVLNDMSNLSFFHALLRMCACMIVIALGVGVGVSSLLNGHIYIFDTHITYTAIALGILIYDHNRISAAMDSET